MRDVQAANLIRIVQENEEQIKPRQQRGTDAQVLCYGFGFVVMALQDKYG